MHPLLKLPVHCRLVKWSWKQERATFVRGYGLVLHHIVPSNHRHRPHHRGRYLEPVNSGYGHWYPWRYW